MKKKDRGKKLLREALPVEGGRESGSANVGEYRRLISKTIPPGPSGVAEGIRRRSVGATLEIGGASPGIQCKG